MEFAQTLTQQGFHVIYELSTEIQLGRFFQISPGKIMEQVVTYYSDADSTVEYYDA